MVFGLSAFFTAISAWIINRITESRRNETRRTLSYWIFHFISAWTNHSQGKMLIIYSVDACLFTGFTRYNYFHWNKGISLRNPSTSLRLVFICSITSVYVLTNYFTATFTSVLSIPILKASVNSIEDVANSSTVKALLFKGTNTDTYIMVSWLVNSWLHLNCVNLFIVPSLFSEFEKNLPFAKTWENWNKERDEEDERKMKIVLPLSRNKRKKRGFK